MIFIDASAYLSLLNPQDNNHEKAITKVRAYGNEKMCTSYAVLGEVLTVGSQRFDQSATIQLVEKLLQSGMLVIIETKELMESAFSLFSRVKKKNISWVDCYSFAIMQKYEISEVFSFDRDSTALRKLDTN